MTPIIRDRVRAVTTQVRHDVSAAAPSVAALVRSMAQALAGAGSIMGLRARRAWHDGAPISDITRAKVARERREREETQS